MNRTYHWKGNHNALCLALYLTFALPVHAETLAPEEVSAEAPRTYARAACLADCDEKKQECESELALFLSACAGIPALSGECTTELVGGGCDSTNTCQERCEKLPATDTCFLTLSVDEIHCTCRIGNDDVSVSGTVFSASDAADGCALCKTFKSEWDMYPDMEKKAYYERWCRFIAGHSEDDDSVRCTLVIEPGAQAPKPRACQ